VTTNSGDQPLSCTVVESCVDVSEEIALQNAHEGSDGARWTRAEQVDKCGLKVDRFEHVAPGNSSILALAGKMDTWLDECSHVTREDKSRGETRRF
jgi:hypothetical protein